MADDTEKKGQQSGQPGQGQHSGQPGQQQEPKKGGQSQNDTNDEDQNRDRQRRAS